MSFAMNAEEAARITVRNLEDFIGAIVQARTAALAKLDNRDPMTLYCWFDEQAAQLRLSMISGADSPLPFRAGINQVSELAIICTEFLQSSYHDGIPWSDLVDVTDATNSEHCRSAPRLNVWQTTVPPFMS